MKVGSKEAARQRLELRRAMDANGSNRTQPSDADYTTATWGFAWMLVATMAVMCAMVVFGVVA